MPTVPGTDSPMVGPADPTSPLVEKPSPTNLLMAAATMKDLGRYDPNSPAAGATPKVPHGRRRR